MNTTVFTDVLVGDVWIAAGQSNMEWPVDWSSEPERERNAANFPRIRLARTMHRVSDYPLEQWVGKTWAACTPDTVRDFSAVAYHFGRNVYEKSGVPIGLVQSAWGGTPIEAWTSLRGLSSDPALMPVFAQWARLTEQHETELLRFPRRMAEWKQQGSRGVAPEMRRRPGGQWTPAGLFNAMIAPLTPMPIRGVIWYQGEANTAPDRAPLYERVFPALIRDWREWWAQGDFPFLFVQLANYKAEPGTLWPVVREAQRRTLSVANTAYGRHHRHRQSRKHPSGQQAGSGAATGTRAAEHLRTTFPSGGTGGIDGTDLVRSFGSDGSRGVDGLRNRWRR